ncbi:MAG: hypothetical protein JRI23_17010 [Deltaproteobacteria bacterium]|jgi:hypothetical protein|nr:hypothetical protein [Deltaproteobacteria bacterium]MBW2533509.1 hypothetical protein [Deltaproteobacteria bacterium]
MKTHMLGALFLCALPLAIGCSTARDVEVTGEVTAAQAVSGPITLSFFEIDEDAEEAERLLIQTSELAELGAFSETVEVAEEIVVVVALADADGDGQCSPGELWGEAEQKVKEDDTVDAFALELRADPCPAAE